MLSAHSYYSYHYGTLDLPQLVNSAAEHGYGTLALTDINTTAAVWDFTALCRDKGIRPVTGIDFRNMEQNSQCLYVGLAKNGRGFTQLNQFLSLYLHNKLPLPERPALPALSECFIIYPWNPALFHSLKENEYVGVRPQDVPLLIRVNEELLRKKAVALYPLSFAGKGDFYLHCLLRAIGRNSLLSKLSPADVGSREECFRTPAQLQEIYSRYPFLLRNAEALLEQCRTELDFKEEKNKKFFTTSREEDYRLLRDKCYAGLERRYGSQPAGIQKEARERLEKELKVVDEKNFICYFLIAWDVVRYAKEEKQYFHAGRGSGANSIAAYCMGITDVDPIELNLFFERFLNFHRSSPPDFDIDFSWKDKDDIIRYLFEKYGTEHTAMLGANNTFQFKAVARELGKVYGLPKNEIDVFIESVRLDERTGSRRMHSIMDQYKQKILIHGLQLIKFPHHLSMHSSGILISEQPIHCYTATDMLPKGLPVTQFDMYSADRFKLHKLDILSQRGLGHIKDCVEIIRRNRGEAVDIHQVEQFTKDAKLNHLLAEGDTIGCFYIESPAMRHLMKKMRCRDFVSLVAASSLIRPGVNSSGMTREYVRRVREPGRYKAIHPLLGELLDETYGVMVYQEDVIKVAHQFADLTLAEADSLRRAMAWKFRDDEGFKKIEAKYFANCRAKGISDAVAQEVWRQMEGFAGFSFCKAHSASYAVESYQSLFLKAYYPMEFMVAVINNFGGFYSTEFYVNEARRAGALIHAPCINRSEHLTCIYGADIYLGFIHIKDLRQELAEAIVPEREHNGPYRSLADFNLRMQPGPEQLNVLVKVGAFAFTGKTKRQLLWEAAMLTQKSRHPEPAQPPLIPPVIREFHIPPLQQSYREDARQEMELLGFPLCSPFELLTTSFRGEIKAGDLINNVGKTVTMMGYLIFRRIAHTSRGEYMQFGAFIDDEGHPFDAVLFPQTYRQYPLISRGVYKLVGKVTEEYDVATLEVSAHERMEVSFEDNTTTGVQRVEANPGTTPSLRNTQYAVRNTPYVLHMDLDSFYVSVERLRNPALIGKPVIVGGTGGRGVVASCSYEARAYGIHSAMPVAAARRLCPNGIYLSGDMDAYSRYSDMVTQIIAERSPLFEKASIDEFYIDLTGMDRFFGAEKWAWELRDIIRKETGLPLSGGLSINKTTGKIAAGEAKPDGKLFVPDDKVKPFLQPLAIEKMPMVGEVTHRFLLDMGIDTIGKLMVFPAEVIQQVMGKNGLSLWRRANGIDPSPVIPYTESKSMSTEQTFHMDTADMKMLRSVLTDMVEKLGHEMRMDNRMTGCVAVKIRYTDFDTVTQQASIPYTSRDDVLLQTTLDLFHKCYTRRVLLRLVGVRFSKLINANYQLQLFDQSARNVHLMMALDKIRDRYGIKAVGRAAGSLWNRDNGHHHIHRSAFQG